MALTSFRTKLKALLRRGGYSQKELAHQLGWHPTFLSNKLNGYNYATLTYAEVKQIVVILAQWQAITTTQEAVELLAEMGLAASSFSPQEWSNSPLSGLVGNQVLTPTYHSESIDGTSPQPKAGPDQPPTLSPSSPAPSAMPEEASSDPGAGRFSQHIYHPAPSSTTTPGLLPPLALLPSPPLPMGDESSPGAVQVRTLYGRQGELARLEQAVLVQRVRLVSLTGLGGSGKSALALKFAQSVQDRFERVLWYSLWNAPPLHTTLAYFLNMLQAGGQPERLPTATTGEVVQQLESLLAGLQQSRCLIILDNFETVLASGQGGSSYLAGYEGYGRLLELVGQQPHQSCVLLTSREKTYQLTLLEQLYPERVFELNLRGLSVESGRQLLEEEVQDQGSFVQGSVAEWEQLIRYYSGNPLALKLLVEPLQMLFGGNLTSFLAEGYGVVGDLEYLLNQQFERLSQLEQEILYWLAVERQPLSLQELKADFRLAVSAKELEEGLFSLRRRSLIEESEAAGYYGLQPVIMEYLTERLITQVVQELNQVKAGNFLANYALLKAETKDYIRESQRKLILQPILDRLQLALKSQFGLSKHLWEIVAQVKTHSLEEQGYEGGNLLNLLVELKAELGEADFSGLRLWQAYLQGVSLEGVNFAGSDLRGCLFTQAFSSVEAVAFSLDGTTVASGGLEGTVRLWEVSSGQCLAVFQGHSGRVWSVAFSPDGKLLASGSADTTIRLWDLSSGLCRQTYQGHTNEVRAVAFSPNGLMIASASIDRSIRMWEIASGKCLKILEGHCDEIWSVAFHPEGTLLATGSADSTIRMWEVTSGQCTRVLTGELNCIWSVAFNPDGNLLGSGSDDRTVRLWEVSSGRCLTILQGHTSRVYAVAFSPDGKLLASGSSDQTIRLWEVAQGQCLKVLDGHHNLIKSLSFSPNGQLLLSGSPDQSVRLWQVESGLCLRIYEGYSSLINSVVYSPDGHYLVTASDDNTIRLWQLDGRQLLKTLRGHNSFVKTVAYSPNRQILASGSADHTIRLWDLSRWQCFRVLEGYPSWVWSVAFSPDGQTLAEAGNDRAIYLWEVASGQRLKVLEGHTNHVRQVVFSPDGHLLASGSTDQTIRLWEVASGECLSIFEGQDIYIQAIAFSPNGKLLASGSSDQTIRLWDLTNGKCRKVLQGHNNWVWVVAFSPDGHLLASSGYDSRVIIWDAKSGEYLFDLPGQSGSVRSLAFHPGGTHLAGGDENYVRVWDLHSREVVQVIKNPGPYEGLNIFGVYGLSAVQEANLLALGALKTEPT